MPRGRRHAAPDMSALEQQLQQLRERQAELRQQIRRLKNSSVEIRKLEDKLAKQFSSAKWTVGQIKQLNPDWDEMKFYHAVQPRKPTPRGRRPRAAAEAQ